MALPGNGRRVLIIVENLPVPFDRRVWQEATTLREAGYQVAVICPTGEGYEARYELLQGVHIYRHPLPIEGRGVLSYVFEYGVALYFQTLLAFSVWRRHGFDLIHACNPPDTIFLVALPYKLFGKRFLFDHHDINPELYEAKFGCRGIKYRLICMLERMTFKLADVTIATNESYRQIALTRGGMSSDKVFVVRSGPNLDRLERKAPNEELKYGRRYMVGYVGVMGPQEGIDYLLRAAAYVIHTRNRRDVHFGLVGGGGSLEEMRKYASELRIADYVTFTGRVSDAELLAVLNTSDVCVNSDVVNEMNDKSTMNKIMEYMALGKPIVQFELKEGRYSARDASLYAKPNDVEDLGSKIIELLDSPERRSSMGAYGRRRVESELSWEHEAPNLLAAYESIFSIDS